MSARVFVDTNVVAYVFELLEGRKQARAARWMEALWASRNGMVSTQVLQEFYNTATRRFSTPMPRDAAREVVRRLGQWDPVVIDQGVITSAFTVEDRYGLSWWDALIVAAAQSAGCAYLLTEDLQHGQNYGGVEVIDFQRADPATVLSA